ncbi:hypothetical protein DYB30_005758 [Aphanomyces astaci]|uniref:histone acetyltransferase n=1 Tax=Aphanomyces astaci TaxID=112090 RepID=A0A397DXA1_APHAT|nr:hypothetical protein DYB30_005758 [Aphanomyces astaci]
MGVVGVVLLLLLLPPWVEAVVSLPNLEFNAALGQIPHASSYYKFDLNPILDTKYVPGTFLAASCFQYVILYDLEGNAIDGLVMQTSWWSSGSIDENVFFQVNFTAESPIISKVVVRWHGYLAAKTYAVKTSYSGYDATFVVFNTFENMSPAWDRVDTVVPWSNSSVKFNFLRLEIQSPVQCNPNITVRCDNRRLASDEGPIYGIREVEVWAASQKSGGFKHADRSGWPPNAISLSLSTIPCHKQSSTQHWAMYDDYPLADAEVSDDDDDVEMVLKGGGFSPTTDLSVVTELPSTYLRASRVRSVVRIRSTYDDDEHMPTTPEQAHTYGATPPSHDAKNPRTPNTDSGNRQHHVAFILHRSPEMNVQRSAQYTVLLARQKERYWNVTPASVEFLVERSLDFVGSFRGRSTAKTVARYILWKQFTGLLDSKRSLERKLRAARMSKDPTAPSSRRRDAPSSTITAPPSNDDTDGFARYKGVKPHSMAESVILDRLKQTLKCSTLKRDPATSDPHHRRKKAKTPKHTSSSRSVDGKRSFFTDTAAPSYADKAKQPMDPRRRVLVPSSPSVVSQQPPPADPRRRRRLLLNELPSSSKASKSPVQEQHHHTLDRAYADFAASPKPRKRARTDPSPRPLYIPPTSHVTGASASLPENWKWRPLTQDIKPIRPFDGMSVEQIEDHLRSIKVEGRMSRFRRFGALLQKLMDHPRNCGGVFNTPVDPVGMNLPTYTSIVRHPMDLGTIKARLESAQYASPEELAADVRLVFTNAMAFNARNHWVHVNADALLAHFNETWSVDKLDESKAGGHACDVCCGHTCAACDQRCLELLVPFSQCFGNCGTTFRKGSTYFVTRDGTRVWCAKCRNKSMKEERILQEDDECFQNPLLSRRNTLPTASEVSAWLIKRKMDVGVEPWVCCSCCGRWMHQVCVLFNPVEAAYDTANKFVCPHCQLQSRRMSSIPPSFLDCTSLPETELSRFLEANLGDAAGDAIDSLCVRTMTFTGQESHLPTEMVHLFQSNARVVRQHGTTREDLVVDVPDKLTHNTKTIFLFQKHHGVDVCLFAMYVQEYDDSVEYAPNRRSVYLAYIDSVRYMEPASIRTGVYHSILTSYFDYIRRHGMERVYIWSCPPQRSQSYVFWCHPPFQKTPSGDHLRSWYKQVLDKAQARGIIQSYGTLYDRHVADVAAQWKKDAAKGDGGGGSSFLWPGGTGMLPLFDGDFIPGELDRIARALKAKHKPRRDKEPPTPPCLKDAFASFLTAMKAMRDDLLQVDLCRSNEGAVVPAKDPPTKLPPFVGSRFAFHQMSSHASYQFDSLRRAKHSTMMLLHQMINASVPQCNTFCHECALLITHADHWFCRTCAHFSLCDWCHAHHGPDHPHLLYRGLDDDEGT